MTMVSAWTKPRLFRPAAEGNVKGDDGLGSIVHVHSFGELRVKERLLSGEHFKVVGLAVVHQFMGAIVCFVQHLHLAVVVLIFLAGGLTVGHRLVHLVAGINHSLYTVGTVPIVYTAERDFTRG